MRTAGVAARGGATRARPTTNAHPSDARHTPRLWGVAAGRVVVSTRRARRGASLPSGRVGAVMRLCEGKQAERAGHTRRSAQHGGQREALGE